MWPVGKGARVAEEARLESVYTSKAYRGFESPSLRQKELFRRKKYAEVAQLIEHQPSKLRAAGLSPVFRSIFLVFRRPCSSGVEHFLGKEEVTGSNPVIGSEFLLERKKLIINKNIATENYG